MKEEAVKLKEIKKGVKRVSTVGTQRGQFARSVDAVAVMKMIA